MSDQQQVGPAPQNVFAAPPQAYPPYAPYGAGPETPPRRSPALGIIAFVAGLAALLVGVVLSAWAAQTYAEIIPYLPALGDETMTIVPTSADRAMAESLGAAVLAIAVWAVLALWALVQGIVATSIARGRGWGIAAIVLSPVSGIACVVVYVVCLVSVFADAAVRTAV